MGGMNTSHWGTSVYLCESMRKRGRGKELRNKNPLSRYLSNRLCLPGDRDWHHFLLVSVCVRVCVYTMSMRVKKKWRKKTCTNWYVNASGACVRGWEEFMCVRLVLVHGRLDSVASAHLSPSGTWQESAVGEQDLTCTHHLCTWRHV